MNYRFNYIIVFIAFTALVSCRKPYMPPAVTASNNYLVVEGVINSGADSTIIKLNRTVKLSNGNTVNPELSAIVTVESDANTSYALTETPNGTYVSPGLNLSATHKYRLRIKTSSNKEYLSDFVPVVNSPAIDNVTSKVESDGVGINLNTHDPANNTHYYRWEYEETWIFLSAFDSHFKSNGDTVLRRDLFNDHIYQCWRTTGSTTIVLGSSAKLSKDVISNTPITFVSRHSDKLRHRYSILVRQYALTSEGYNFWTNLKKNTEQLGSIFDAQPSQIKGNIHSTADPLEPVIGYVSIGSFSTQRIFVDENDLPAWLDPIDNGCQAKPYLYAYKDPITGGITNQVDEYINYNKTSFSPLIPVDAIVPPGGSIVGYTAAVPECVDCTLFGTNKQPSFWQ